MRPRLSLLALLVLAAATALAGAGCSTRERANPFDPANPNTGGAPPGFVALAGNGRIDLHWNAVPISGLQGYRLLRKTATDITYVEIASLLPPQRTSYSDVGLRNGLDHSYRLYFVFSSGADNAPPAEDVATPGPQRPWVAEGNTGRLLGVTPDGRRVGIIHSGFDRPTAVAVDSVTGRVWFSDNFTGRVVSIDVFGVITTIQGLVSPGALAAEPLHESVWVCDEDNNKVQELLPNGTPLGPPIEPINTPIGIAIAQWDRSVWICERGADRVRRYAFAESLIWSIPLAAPSRVATDSLEQRAWVTSFTNGTVHKIAPSGTVEGTFPGFQGPIGVAVDTRRGRIWIAEALGNQITVINRSGAVAFRVTGLSETRDVAVDLTTGEAWAVAPGSGQIVRIAADGRVVRRITGLNNPYGVGLDPGR